MKRQPWLFAPLADTCFILAPPFLATLAALILTSAGIGSEVSLGWWLLLVVGVDVAHVYGTLFRTYLDPRERARRPFLYVGLPLAAWAVGALLYGLDALLFWRVLAYLAVFHFVRQQYGFVMLYARDDERSLLARRIDAWTVYLAAIYPLAYWHTHLPRSFQWFVAGDFIALPGVIEPIARAGYITVLIAYVVKEVAHARTRGVNLPKNLVIAGTAVSWFTGIVLLDGDLAFTITNVVAHGVPYLALVWFHGHGAQKALACTPTTVGRLFTSGRSSVAFGLVLVFLAYCEEGLWDGLVWREHAAAFSVFANLPALHGALLTLVVPLLAVPQVTHYVIDGFIWRVRDRRADWLRDLVSDPREVEITPPASLRRPSPAVG